MSIIGRINLRDDDEIVDPVVKMGDDGIPVVTAGRSEETKTLEKLCDVLERIAEAETRKGGEA
jgi:hypothetical protein